MEENENADFIQPRNSGQRNLDVATEASIDLVSLNNKIVKMRPVVRRVKVHLIHKMTRRINVLKKKKGSDEQRQKNLSKGQRILDEIQAMKHLSADKISKYALSSTLTFADVCKRATVSDELRALSRMSEHKLLSDIVNQFRKEHEDWQSLTAFVLMNPGRRFKKKRRRKPKDKTATNIKAGKDLVKVYLGGKFEGDEELLIPDKVGFKQDVTNVNESEVKTVERVGDKEPESEDVDEESEDEVAESDEESEVGKDFVDKSVIAIEKVKVNQKVKVQEEEDEEKMTNDKDDDDDDNDNDGEDDDEEEMTDDKDDDADDDDDDDDGDDGDDDGDDDIEEEEEKGNLVKKVESSKKSSKVEEVIFSDKGSKMQDKYNKKEKISFVDKLSPSKNSDSKQSTTEVSGSERKEMVVKKLNLDEIPDEINVSVTLDEVPSGVVNKTKQRHKDSFFASSDVDENSDDEKSSDDRLGDDDDDDDSKSDFDEDNEQLYRGGKVMHSTFLGSLADRSDTIYKNKTRGGSNRNNRNSNRRDSGRGKNYDFDSRNRQGPPMRHGNTRGRFDRQRGGDRQWGGDRQRGGDRQWSGDRQRGSDRRFSQNDRKSYSNQNNYRQNTWDSRKQYTDRTGSGKQFGNSDNSNKTFSKQNWIDKNEQNSNTNRDRNKKFDVARNEDQKQHNKLDVPVESAEKLHPSWQASKKRKEQSQIQVFAGKKIKFDDD